MKGLGRAIYDYLSLIPCHLRASSIHQLPVDTALATPGYFCCGHKKAANICSLTVPSQINQQKWEDWILFEGPVKAPSGLTSCVWVISQSLNPSLQPNMLDMLIGLCITVLSYMYQGPYMYPRVVCWGFPRLPPVLWFAKRTHRTQCIVIPWLWFVTAKQYQAKSEKGRGCMEWKSWGNQAHASKSPLPRESHRTHLIPPASNCDNRYEMSTKTQCPRF